MNVSVEQVGALNYATTHLEATYVLVTVDTHFILTIIRAMVKEYIYIGEDEWFQIEYHMIKFCHVSVCFTSCTCICITVRHALPSDQRLEE